MFCPDLILKPEIIEHSNVTLFQYQIIILNFAGKIRKDRPFSKVKKYFYVHVLPKFVNYVFWTVLENQKYQIVLFMLQSSTKIHGLSLSRMDFFNMSF